MPVREREKRLDQKDLKILQYIERHGGKVSAEQLADELDIPARTIRYRLSQLRKSGFLAYLLAQTHEIELGMGDQVILWQVNNEHSHLLPHIFELIPQFYFWSSTYGKFNGVIFHSAYPVTTPNVIQEICNAVKDYGIIDDYHIFTVTDYFSTQADLKSFSPDEGWTWDWKEWVKMSNKVAKSRKKPKLELNYNPGFIDFDYKDIVLLNTIKEDARLTLREIGAKLDLSDSQTSARIKRLEDLGVIKGYRWVIKEYHDSMYLYLFFELKEPDAPILISFSELPFPKELMMENRRCYCLRLRLHSKDLGDFLRGFDRIKHHLQSYYVQTMHELEEKPHGLLLRMFKQETGRCEMNAEEYIGKVEKFLKSKKVI